jgi:small subunit ribosomal protein S14
MPYFPSLKTNLINKKKKKMAKKSIIQRQLKREKLTFKFQEKRKQYLKDCYVSESLPNKLSIHKKIEKLPRDSAKVRLRNRCWKTGRGRGFYKDFGLCRHMIREMAHNCLLPGLYKASW